MDFLDYVRLGNALLASLVFCGLVYKGRLYFKTYDKQQKMLYISFTLYALTASYGSVEAIAQGAPFGYRIILLLIANLMAITAFALYQGSAFTSHDNEK